MIWPDLDLSFWTHIMKDNMWEQESRLHAWRWKTTCESNNHDSTHDVPSVDEYKEKCSEHDVTDVAVDRVKWTQDAKTASTLKVVVAQILVASDVQHLYKYAPILVANDI